ncbi:hypothetical protein TNIN_20451 [Trichonephila inaurata madagascariensis]|uniref:Uncharacterized protein n=1 Tax=Trichonephila inaurata madagascariensis TaxID=2747483 RepID=A0A8X7BS12_9ARAC|nr:hypothetical protein TNIN_20451 [Trichonephila inaurata madagascariensis]
MSPTRQSPPLIGRPQMLLEAPRTLLHPTGAVRIMVLVLFDLFRDKGLSNIWIIICLATSRIHHRIHQGGTQTDYVLSIGCSDTHTRRKS